MFLAFRKSNVHFRISHNKSSLPGVFWIQAFSLFWDSAISSQFMALRVTTLKCLSSKMTHSTCRLLIICSAHSPLATWPQHNCTEARRCRAIYRLFGEYCCREQPALVSIHSSAFYWFVNLSKFINVSVSQFSHL